MNDQYAKCYNISPMGEERIKGVFKRASDVFRDNLQDKVLSLENRLFKWIKKWCLDWKKDLESRPQRAANSARGQSANNEFNVTMKAFAQFFEQLKKRTFNKEIKNGFWAILLAMKRRNYLRANTILLNTIAIGNAPWPIGVTQVRV